jgi:hypothetical protein
VTSKAQAKMSAIGKPVRTRTINRKLQLDRVPRPEKPPRRSDDYAARDDVGAGHAVNFSALQFLKEAADNKRLTECEGNASMHSLSQQ